MHTPHGPNPERNPEIGVWGNVIECVLLQGEKQHFRQ